MNLNANLFLRLLRIVVLQAAVSIKLENVVEPAKTLFNDWMSNGKRIGPNIRDVVYVAGKKLSEASSVLFEQFDTLTKTTIIYFRYKIWWRRGMELLLVDLSENPSS